MWTEQKPIHVDDTFNELQQSVKSWVIIGYGVVTSGVIEIAVDVVPSGFLFPFLLLTFFIYFFKKGKNQL